MDIYENSKIRSIGYQLTFAPDFLFRGGSLSEELDMDTVRYAVRRFLTRSDRLMATLAHMSYRLRLASGRDSKPRRLVLVVPAEQMELPGNWAELKLTVDAKAITVRFLALKREYPNQTSRKSARKDAPVISSWVPEDDLPQAGQGDTQDIA